MFNIIDGYVYKIKQIETPTQKVTEKILLNAVEYSEEVDGVVTNYKFNLETGEYEVV